MVNVGNYHTWILWDGVSVLVDLCCWSPKKVPADWKLYISDCLVWQKTPASSASCFKTPGVIRLAAGESNVQF